MSTTVRALLAVFGSQIAAKHLKGRSRWAIAAPATAVFFPWVTAAAAVFWAVGRGVRLRLTARRRETLARADVVTLAELSGLGLAAGFDFAGSLQRAAEPLSAEVRAEVQRMLRRARRRGLSVALATEGGRCRRFFRLTARAVEAGAPVQAAVGAFVDGAHSAERARSLAAIRRLPVKLLFPLALLILPGFLLLTVGPALLGGLQRLGL